MEMYIVTILFKNKETVTTEMSKKTVYSLFDSTWGKLKEGWIESDGNIINLDEVIFLRYEKKY